MDLLSKNLGLTGGTRIVLPEEILFQLALKFNTAVSVVIAW
jgi:hypothetical protein